MHPASAPAHRHTEGQQAAGGETEQLKRTRRRQQPAAKLQKQNVSLAPVMCRPHASPKRGTVIHSTNRRKLGWESSGMHTCIKNVWGRKLCSGAMQPSHIHALGLGFPHLTTQSGGWWTDADTARHGMYTRLPAAINSMTGTGVGPSLSPGSLASPRDEGQLPCASGQTASPGLQEAAGAAVSLGTSVHQKSYPYSRDTGRESQIRPRHNVERSP